MREVRSNNAFATWSLRRNNHMPHFNGVELVIVLAIILVLFGAGRVGKLGGELGTALREFRKGLNGDQPTSTDTTPQSAPTSDPTKLPPANS
jgi:TatA/E family protein of Tat protein translocase